MRWSCAALLTLSACGRIGFDNLGGDGGPDPDAPVPPDRVRVRVRGPAPSITAPQAGLVVWSSTASGALIEQAVTDAAGEALLLAESGGSVTAVFLIDGIPVSLPLIQTRLDVLPGETVELGLSFAEGCVSNRGTATISWEPRAGATSYQLGGTCDELTTADLTIAWPLGSNTPDPGDVVLRALDSDGGVIASAVREGVPLPDGATIAFADVDWQEPADLPLSIAGLPEAISTVDLIGSFYTPSSTIPNAGVVEVTAFNIDGEATELVTVPAIANRMRLDAELMLEDSTLWFMARMPVGVLAPVVLASTPSRVTPPVFDGVGRRLAWSVVEPGVTDAVEILSFFGDVGGSGTLWTLHGPGDLTSVTYPAVPPGVLIPIDFTPILLAVAPIDYIGLAGWEEARTRPTWELLGSFEAAHLERPVVFGTEGVSPTE